MIGKAVKSVGVFVSEMFICLFGADASKQFADASLKLLRSEAGQLVLGAVQKIEQMALAGTLTDITDAGKREQALAMAATALERAGITVATSVLNLLIELAVQAVKRNIAEA